jgi:glycosyltransferase involved in cell wall biosynthesis
VFLSAHLNTQPTWRGGEQQTLYLLQGLRRRGYPVALFSAPGTPLFERARAEGFDPRPLSIRSEADAPAVIRLARELKRLRPAVLHMHTSHAHTIGVCAAALARRGIKRIVSRRVDFSIYRHSFLGLNRLKYAYGVDRYLAVSNLVRDVLIDDGIRAERVCVVHSGVDPDRFRDSRAVHREDLLREWGLPPGTPIVGGVGALVSHKGFEHLVDAAALVLGRRDAVFVIAGEGDLLESLSRRVAEKGIEGKVRFLGFQSDVGGILGTFDVFAFPSIKEGLGTSVLDAFLLERPVVASRVGGIPEMVRHGENGLLVEPGDAAALGAAIEELLAHPDEGCRMGAAGRRTALESFSVDSMVEKTLDAYHDVLKNGDGSE